MLSWGFFPFFQNPVMYDREEEEEGDDVCRSIGLGFLGFIGVLF